uniref:FoP_duplication domain-containing protein n=1 Tax=Heterorhabditis bacteriophora TaxID=37862 RepID=A0A1I7X201_HETBA
MGEIVVPSKIVIVGTSNMSLHQRFSKIGKPIVGQRASEQRTNLRGFTKTLKAGEKPLNVGRRGAAMNQNQASVYENYVNDIEEMDDYVEEYVPVHRMQSRPRRIAPMYRSVPIGSVVIPKQRLSIPTKPRFVYVPMPTNTVRNGRGGYRRGVVRQNNFQPRYNLRGVQSRGGFKTRGGFPSFGSRRGVLQSRGEPKKSVAQLDKELDDYMKKPKHPPITI